MESRNKRKANRTQSTCPPHIKAVNDLSRAGFCDNYGKDTKALNVLL